MSTVPTIENENGTPFSCLNLPELLSEVKAEEELGDVEFNLVQIDPDGLGWDSMPYFVDYPFDNPVIGIVAHYEDGAVTIIVDDCGQIIDIEHELYDYGF